MKLKKSIKKKIMIIMIAFVVVILATVGYFGYKRFFAKKPTTVKPKVVEKIDSYGYELEENALKTYKTLYKELSNLLQKDNFDEKEYANLVARLLVTDFYTLDDKISKNDIGGVQFIREEQQKNFILEASETVYKYIEHNVYGNRNQKLPIVKETTIKSCDETTFKYKSIEEDKAYKVVVEVSYEEDLGYPEKVTVVLIHNKDNAKKLEVIKMY